MNKTDVERLKKIVRLWEALDAEVNSRGITKEQLLDDQFAQWAVTTPIYNIGEQVYQLSDEIKRNILMWNGGLLQGSDTVWYMIMKELTGR